MSVIFVKSLVSLIREESAQLGSDIHLRHNGKPRLNKRNEPAKKSSPERGHLSENPLHLKTVKLIIKMQPRRLDLNPQILSITHR